MAGRIDPGGAPGSFRSQGRFADPMAVVPAEWTAPTPPTGVPARPTPATSASPPAPPPTVATDAPRADPAPFLDPAADAALGSARRGPSAGWRKWLHRGSGGLVDVGESAKTLRHDELVAAIQRPLRDCYRIAVLSQKGGVGKTTVTATLGATFASLRGDRVIAVDANPDRGTLSQKVPAETPATVRHLLRDAEGVEAYSDVRQYTSRGAGGLEVLASESDPAVSEAFSAADYLRTVDLLERFYGVMLTDCGTGMLHSAMSAVLDTADVLVVVSSGSVDGARSASATLDWLDAHGHEDLVRNSLAVLNAVRPRPGRRTVKVDLEKVADHFSRRCRAVRTVPFDPHLDEGAEVDLDRLRPETRTALLEVAAAVAEGFPASPREAQA